MKFTIQAWTEGEGTMSASVLLLQFACLSVSACAAVKLFGSRGITVTPAHVSTGKSLLVVKFLMLRRRQLGDGPVSCVATANRECFLILTWECTLGSHIFSKPPKWS